MIITPDDLNKLLCDLQNSATMSAHISDGIYDKYTLSSERQAIFENLVFFPHIELRQLQINLQRFSELFRAI